MPGIPVIPTRGLTSADLDAIADLEARVVAHDGGRLKLEWGRLRGRSGVSAEDVLARSEDGRLVGFAGLYGPGPGAVEIAGMVDPECRGRGLGGALLDVAGDLCAQAGGGAPLLIVTRASAGGRALALRRGGVLEHSEHALVLHGEPVDGPRDPALSMRDAERSDAVAVSRILSAAFGYAPADAGERLDRSGTRALVIEHAGEIVGTMWAVREVNRGGVYGFAVDPSWQGRGIGRDALRRVCRDLRRAGATEIGLEVEVDNEPALGLYTSLGFAPVVTEDYWRLAV